MAISDEGQIQALELLFNSTQGDQWRWKNEVINGPKWSFTSPQVNPCNDKNQVWQGITCSSSPNICKVQSCKIVSLVLKNYNLNGTLPAEFFVQLNTLTKFVITSSVGLTGTIPSEIGSLSQLSSISLYENQLAGSIPSEIVFLSQLTSLYLDNNQLTGTLLSGIGFLSRLGLLYLDNNQLTGAIPSGIGSLSQLGSCYLSNNLLGGTIPSEIGSLSQLSSLSLSNNQLRRGIPSSIGSLSQLIYLYLNDNYLTGTMPSEICSLSLLAYLFLDNNRLRGIIPSEIGSLSKLMTLSMYENQLSGTIPSIIGSLSQLVGLYLDKNRLRGTIPPGIGFLTQLSSLILAENQLTGTIPPDIGSLSRLSFLSLDKNQLRGTIPSEIGSLSQLSSFYLDTNQLMGTIPYEIGSLSRLGSLYLSNNQLTGTIPSVIASLSPLLTVSLDGNQLIGTIPSEISSLSNLGSLSLYDNQLTGTIPSEIGSLSQLVVLYLDNNQLRGTIPSGVFSLSRLVVLDLYNNHFTGTIPSAISSLSLLDSLSLYNNQLTGIIPSEIGFLYQLRFLSLDKNGLTGTIPFSFSNLLNLVWIHLHHNKLNGAISFPLTSLPKLQQLFLHQNRFTGRVDTLFSSSPSNSSSSELLNLDLSDNLFSGSIPATLFLPHLESISLSLNCFEHELPSAICDAREATVMSMDALGSAESCKDVVTVPFTSITFLRSLEGNIPECVWQLANLKILNLAGNGLKGTISATAAMPSLFSLTLSHNYLSGEIPLWLQKMNLSNLDLSHNKLAGGANGFRHQDDNPWIFEMINNSLGSQYLSRKLTLSVNRLSGDLPDSFVKYQDLDILSGNLFGCAYLPTNDGNSEFVSCGSENYDRAMVLMVSLLASMLCLVPILHLLCRIFPSSRCRMWTPHIFLRYLRYHTITFQRYPNSKSQIDSTPHVLSLDSTLLFGSLLSRLRRSVWVLMMLCLLLSLPIYVLKELDVESGDQKDPQYVTHNHMYNWLWTIAFLSGSIPASILLMMCLVCLFYFTFVMNRLGRGIDLKEETTKPISPLSLSTFHEREKEEPHHYSLTLIFILNVVVVATVNGLYLWSTLLDLSTDIRIWIQFSFGLFSFLWSVALRLGLPSQIAESKSGIWLFTCLNVINNVIIPCIVTVLSSPSCYQRLLVPPNDISSSYSYQYCALTLSDLNGNLVCVYYAPKIMDVLKITPPFFYSYQCGSTIITSYIPVYIYSLSLQILLLSVTFLFIIFSATTTDQYPQWLLKSFPGVCWPSRWNNFDHPGMNLAVPTRLINPHQIISRFMNNIVLLLSFGLCSPVLCCYVVLSISLHLCYWLVLIGRFVCQRIDTHSTPRFPLLGLSFYLNFTYSPYRNQRRSAPASLESPTTRYQLLPLTLQVASHHDFLLLCDFVGLGHGRGPSWMVPRLVGSADGSWNDICDMGLGPCPHQF